MRPEWDFSPIRMRTMHHLPHIFFDTLRPERPDCPVLVPSSFSRSRDRIINMDIYSYEPCGLPTGNFMPAEKSQIRLMTASPITVRACIPAPDQVTPQQAYFKDLDFYKKTLFHTPFLSLGRAVTLLEYRDAQIVFEVDNWFSQLPQGVQLHSTTSISIREVVSGQRARPHSELLILHFVQNQTNQPTATPYATPRSLARDMVLPYTWMSFFFKV